MVISRNADTERDVAPVQGATPIQFFLALNGAELSSFQDLAKLAYNKKAA
jgi:hypothetical protein